MNVHFKNIAAARPPLPEKIVREKNIEVLVFKTNLKFKKDIDLIAPVLTHNRGIIRWNVDQQDIDNVLRIETLQLQTEDVIGLVTNAGYFCEELPD